jgi:uroporphyrinogen decarboxylase
MLTKDALKDCLAGRPTPIAPAWLFWFDKSFTEAHPSDVERLRRDFNNDFFQAGVRYEKRAEDPPLEPGEFVDPWGCLFEPGPNGVGMRPARPIIRRVKEWERYAANRMPEMRSETFGEGIRKAVAEHPDRYILARLWRTFYERMSAVIGFEPLMIEIAMDGELFEKMLVNLRDFTIRAIELIADAGATGVYLSDDWGTAERLHISLDQWRKRFKPAYGAMIEAAHGRGLDVWLHSCGAITDLIPEWIDLGLDVIGHCKPGVVDLTAIAERFHGKIAIYGAIDAEHNLVNGTRASIREEVRTRMRGFHANEGRFIASPASAIRAGTPVENVQTLFEAIREFGQATP